MVSLHSILCLPGLKESAIRHVNGREVGCLSVMLSGPLPRLQGWHVSLVHMHTQGLNTCYTNWWSALQSPQQASSSDCLSVGDQLPPNNRRCNGLHACVMCPHDSEVSAAKSLSAPCQQPAHLLNELLYGNASSLPLKLYQRSSQSMHCIEPTTQAVSKIKPVHALLQTRELLRKAEEEEARQASEPLPTTTGRVFHDEPEQRWDCESVLSMRSNLDNHPGVISEQSRRRYRPVGGKIKLAAKTGQQSLLSHVQPMLCHNCAFTAAMTFESTAADKTALMFSMSHANSTRLSTSL